MESIKPDRSLIAESGLTTPCSTCAYLRKTTFKKYLHKTTTLKCKGTKTGNHGRVIWWCRKQKYLGSTGADFGTGLSHQYSTCDEHETKEERRKANDAIRNKIIESSASKRIIEKSW